MQEGYRRSNAPGNSILPPLPSSPTKDAFSLPREKQKKPERCSRNSQRLSLSSFLRTATWQRTFIFAKEITRDTSRKARRSRVCATMPKRKKTSIWRKQPTPPAAAADYSSSASPPGGNHSTTAPVRPSTWPTLMPPWVRTMPLSSISKSPGSATTFDSPHSPRTPNSNTCIRISSFAKCQPRSASHQCSKPAPRKTAGAGRGNRTPKGRSPADFESAASASSAIPARGLLS